MIRFRTLSSNLFFQMNVKTGEVLKKLEEIETTENPHWNIPRESGVFLNSLVKSMNAKSVLEIGTSNGYSGIWLAEALQITGGKLITVESHKARFAEAENNFKEAGVEKYVEQILGHAPEVILDRTEKFDIIFSDATKCETLSYFEKLSGKLRQHGLIITDNTATHADELAEFISAVQANKDFQSTLLTLGNGFMVSLKLSE